MPRGKESTDPIKRTRTSFRAMWGRCTYKKGNSWKYYGGRGIKVCARWRSFANFVADLGLRPAGTTIDRFPNGDGNYEPGNVRWATAKQQGHSAIGRPANAAWLENGRRMRAEIACRRKWESYGSLYTSLDLRNLADEVLDALQEEFGALPATDVDPDELAMDPDRQPVLFYPDADEVTLEELGCEFGITRERVRQIEEAALGKLRVLFQQDDAGEPLSAPNSTEARRLYRQAMGRSALTATPRKAAA